MIMTATTTPHLQRNAEQTRLIEESKKWEALIKGLLKACREGNKKRILQLYDEAALLDENALTGLEFDKRGQSYRYNKAIDKCNDLLYSGF